MTKKLFSPIRIMMILSIVALMILSRSVFAGISSQKCTEVNGPETFQLD